MNYIDTQRCQVEINHLKSVLRQCRQGTEARDWSAVQPMRGGEILPAENLIGNSKRTDSHPITGLCWSSWKNIQANQQVGAFVISTVSC